MAKHSLSTVDITLEKIVGGGQALATLADGLKVFVWGGLPGEKVVVQLTKKKRSYAEGIVTKVLQSSSERIEPKDPESFLSTSPWQIMTPEAEQMYKSALINEAFSLHDVSLPSEVNLFTDSVEYGYRNKVEFSFWWDKGRSELDLAFFRRGSHGKVPVGGTSLAMHSINQAALSLRDVLRERGDEAFHFKTAIVRSDQAGKVVLQLYVKEPDYRILADEEISLLGVQGFELVYSNPKSPASVITKRLQTWGNVVLSDKIHGTPFTYTAENFFQVNLPVYEQALQDIATWVDSSNPTVDLYSGSGSLGLSVASGPLTLIEINVAAVEQMKKTIQALGREKTAQAILSSSEDALNFVSPESTVIVDPPRAGLHQDVIRHLNLTRPPRIIYLSCNPVTQARDVALLRNNYLVQYTQGYNFFPRTPHVEHLVVLDLKTQHLS